MIDIRRRYETKETAAFFHVQHMYETILEPGATPPLDLLPFLKYVPERWASWKTLAREVRKEHHALYFGLLGECEARVASGRSDGQEAFMDEVVRRRTEFGLTREMAGSVCYTLLRHHRGLTIFSDISEEYWWRAAPTRLRISYRPSFLL